MNGFTLPSEVLFCLGVILAALIVLILWPSKQPRQSFDAPRVLRPEFKGKQRREIEREQLERAVRLGDSRAS